MEKLEGPAVKVEELFLSPLKIWISFQHLERDNVTVGSVSAFTQIEKPIERMLVTSDGLFG